MPRIERREKRLAAVAAAVAAAFVATNAFVIYGVSLVTEEFIILAAILALFPLATLETLDSMWKRSADETLPDILRSIARAMEGGVTFRKAVSATSETHKGPLSKQLRKMAIRLSWGASYDEAVRKFAESVGTKMARLVATLAGEAVRVGGPVSEVLSSSAEFVGMVTALGRTRRTEVRPYVVIIYVGYFIFLFTAVLLYQSFFVPLATAGLAGLEMVISLPELKRLFLHIIAIQAICSGLVAGKMEEGTVAAGLKHAVVMLLAGFLTYKLFLAPIG